MLRTVRGDWAALGTALWRATYRGGLDYAARSACVVGLFAPAVGLLYLAGNAAIYLQLALVGPLLVAPILGAFAGGLVPGGEIWDDIAIPGDAHTSAQRARGLGLAFSISF